MDRMSILSEQQSAQMSPYDALVELSFALKLRVSLAVVLLCLWPLLTTAPMTILGPLDRKVSPFPPLLLVTRREALPPSAPDRS